MTKANLERLQKFAFFSLFFCVAVILWGAVVRATGSGAGCGEHWPLCNGEVLPLEPSHKTIIEYLHRLSSGLSLVVVIALYFWVKKSFPKGSPARRAAGWALFAILIEAALGAGLVLLKLVEHDQSIDRAISIALHLVNTLFLLAALTATAFYLVHSGQWVWPKKLKRISLLLLGAFVVLGALGALTALGDTLFRPASVAAGWEAHSDIHSHFLEKIRILHPIFAVTWATFAMIWSIGWMSRLPKFRKHWILLMILVGLNILAGVSNILLLAPVWLQIFHLFLADLIWIQFIWAILCAAISYAETEI